MPRSLVQRTRADSGVTRTIFTSTLRQIARTAQVSFFPSPLPSSSTLCSLSRPSLSNLVYPIALLVVAFSQYYPPFTSNSKGDSSGRRLNAPVASPPRPLQWYKCPREYPSLGIICFFHTDILVYLQQPRIDRLTHNNLSSATSPFAEHRAC